MLRMSLSFFVKPNDQLVATKMNACKSTTQGTMHEEQKLATKKSLHKFFTS
jgi:hypothetical protein